MAVTAFLHIETAVRQGKTFLKKGFAQHPFKIANISADRSTSSLELMLMSSSPGVLDGDQYKIEIRVAAGTALRLTTQSYQRLFSMKQGASQEMQVIVGEGACFSYLPHPTVPHASSSFVAKNNIQLSDNYKLGWGEVITSGRKLNGEEFLFNRYQNLTEIYLHKKLMIQENLLLQPLLSCVHSIGQLGNYTHQATLILLDDKGQLSASLPLIHEWLNTQENISAGISAAPLNGVIIRILGFKAEQLFHCLQFISARFFQENLKATAV